MLKDNKTQKKKSHPYRGLAMFTLAAAGMISVTNSVKRFVKDKAEKVSSFFKKTTD